MARRYKDTGEVCRHAASIWELRHCLDVGRRRAHCDAGFLFAHDRLHGTMQRIKGDLHDYRMMMLVMVMMFILLKDSCRKLVDGQR